MASQSQKARLHYTETTKKGGPSKHGTINFIEEKPRKPPRPISWRHLFKRPVVRQYILQGERAVWREREEREPSRFELFFDLIFVGIIHQLADGATEEFSGRSVAKFIVLFYPPWVVWQGTRTFLNHSGTDDIIQRLLILLTMALLLGYSANASAIDFLSTGDATANNKADLQFPTLQAAILFFLAARSLYLTLHLIYGQYIIKFRKSQLFTAIGIFVQAAVYFPLIWVRDETTFWTLTALGTCSLFLLPYTIGLTIVVARYCSENVSRTMGVTYVPARNIEHHIERTSQFIIIVLGEAVLNLTYKAAAREIGVGREFGRAIMGLISAYFLCWLYFDQDASHTFVHALRRHWFTAFSADILHFPLCAGLILWSASLKLLVENDEVQQGVHWYFSGGLATVLLCLGIFGWLHKNLDAQGSSLISYHVRLLVRILGAIIFALLPLSKGLKNSAQTLGIHAGILIAIVMFETIGKLGSVPNVEELFGEVLPQEQMEEGDRVDVTNRDPTDTDKAGDNTRGDIGEVEQRPITDRLALASTAF